MKIWHLNTALVSTFLVISPVLATNISVEPQSWYVDLQNKNKFKQPVIYTAQNPLDSKAYLSRGMSRYNAGDKKGAIADFSRAIKLNPKNASAYNERGITLGESGDIEGAIADFNNAIKFNPNLGQSYHNRGNAYAILEDKPRAIQDFKKAAQLYEQQGNKKLQNSSLEMLRRLQN